MYEVWDGMYIGINNANLLLSKVTPDSYKADNKNTYMGEAYFLRGFNYLKLVSQYGGVPLKLLRAKLRNVNFLALLPKKHCNR